MQDMNSNAHEETRGQQGLKWLGRFIAIISILGVAAYSDIMYIQLIQPKLPPGIAQAVCYVGALTSFFCTIYLLIGKFVLFTPGKQMTLAWIVLGAELTMMALNIILVVNGVGNSKIMDVWEWIAAATPVFNLIGIFVLLFMDRDQEEKYADMELAAYQAEQDRKYKKAVHKAKMDVQYRQLQIVQSELARGNEDPLFLAVAREQAHEMRNSIFAQLTGLSFNRPAAPTIQAGPGSGAIPMAPASLAQTAQIPQAPTSLPAPQVVPVQEPQQVTPASQSGAAQVDSKKSGGRKLTDAEVNEAIRQYHESGVMPKDWSSRRMKAYIRHRYPNGYSTKHDNLS